MVIYKVTELDEQKFTELMKIPGKHQIIRHYESPLPPQKISKQSKIMLGYENNEGFDSYGIFYQICRDTLTISIPNIEIDASFVHYISNLPDFVKTIVINIKNENRSSVLFFNHLCSLLEKNKCKAKIILSINSVEDIKKNSRLDFEKLPSNVLVSNHLLNRIGEEADYLRDDSTCFNTWMLWLSDEDFSTVIERLTPHTKKKVLKEAEIARKMYLAFKKEGIDRFSDHDKTVLVFKWCMEHARYSTENLREDGNLKVDCEFESDSVATYERGKGVCGGRSNLMKLLLNNRYMRVDCYLEEGRHGRPGIGNSLGHVWNVVFYENGDLRRYDLSYEIIDCKELPPVYFDTELEKSIPSDVGSPISPPPLPPRPVDRINILPPPLPPQHGSK